MQVPDLLERHSFLPQLNLCENQAKIGTFGLRSASTHESLGAVAQLLGLRGREQYLDRQVADAYEELRGLELESGYTPRVAAGRAACLEEARRALQASRGRVTRDGAGVQVAHDALPGALALLQEVRAGSRGGCIIGPRSSTGTHMCCLGACRYISIGHVTRYLPMCHSDAALTYMRSCLLVLPVSS